MLQLIYQDPWFIAIDKPANLLAVPAKDPNRTNALTSIQQSFPEARIVHRLDEPTSGVLLFALNKQSQSAIQMQFRQRTIHKIYVAIVAGVVHSARGDIHLPLRADWPNRPKQIVCHALGKPAHTHWYTLRNDQCSTRLKLMPSTGRTHQLRLHLASIGHPIIGDTLYQPHSNKTTCRLHLHAHELTFHHPYINHAITLKTQLPF